MLYDKVKKPQFRQWYVKEIFGKNISPGTVVRADLSKIIAFLLMFPPNKIDLIIKLTNYNLVESGEKLFNKSMMLKKLELLCYSLVVLYAIRGGFGTKTEKCKYLTSPKFNRTGIKYWRFEEIL